MKKFKFSVPIVLISVFITLVSFNGRKDINPVKTVAQDTLPKYMDGIFEGQSRSTYTNEPYWGKVRITIEKGSLAGINFIIRDSNLHETFNENYEKHFEGNQLYIEQCRNDWNGVKIYPKKALEARDIGKIDAISGATWSFNIFKASADEALRQAAK